jgi:hypothetical protein
MKITIGSCACAALAVQAACLAVAVNSSAGESNGVLLKAKKEAESKGYVFETSRDAILAKAKQEGSIKVLSGLDPSSHPSMMAGFKKKYPFLKFEMAEITGPD